MNKKFITVYDDMNRFYNIYCEDFEYETFYNLVQYLFKFKINKEYVREVPTIRIYQLILPSLFYLERGLNYELLFMLDEKHMTKLINEWEKYTLSFSKFELKQLYDIKNNYEKYKNEYVIKELIE